MPVHPPPRRRRLEHDAPHLRARERQAQPRALRRREEAREVVVERVEPPLDDLGRVEDGMAAVDEVVVEVDDGEGRLGRDAAELGGVEGGEGGLPGRVRGAGRGEGLDDLGRRRRRRGRRRRGGGGGGRKRVFRGLEKNEGREKKKKKKNSILLPSRRRKCTPSNV